MNSAQLKKQASYLCLILLVLVACKSKSPPTFDIINSDAVREKIEKNDVDGAITDIERQIARLNALANQPNQPTPVQMFGQWSAIVAMLKMLMEQEGLSAEQKNKLERLEEQANNEKKKYAEKAEESETSEEEAEETEESETSEEEDDENTDEEEEESTDGDEEGDDTEETGTKIEPGVYLYLDAEKGAMVFELKGDEEIEDKKIKTNKYEASIYQGVYSHFQLKGYRAEGVDFPESVTVYGTVSTGKGDDTIIETVVEIQDASIEGVIDLNLTKKDNISTSNSLHLGENTPSEDE